MNPVPIRRVTTVTYSSMVSIAGTSPADERIRVAGERHAFSFALSDLPAIDLAICAAETSTSTNLTRVAAIPFGKGFDQVLASRGRVAFRRYRNMTTLQGDDLEGLGRAVREFRDRRASAA